jgi:hypothetical protein
VTPNIMEMAPVMSMKMFTSQLDCFSFLSGIFTCAFYNERDC